MNNEHPINEIFELYPEYPKDWIEYAFLRWCHPLGALAWTPAFKKAKEKHPDWVSWLEKDCFQFVASEDDDWKEFLSNELENFKHRTTSLV